MSKERRGTLPLLFLQFYSAINSLIFSEGEISLTVLFASILSSQRERIKGFKLELPKKKKKSLFSEVTETAISAA